MKTFLFIISACFLLSRGLNGPYRKPVSIRYGAVYTVLIVSGVSTSTKIDFFPTLSLLFFTIMSSFPSQLLTNSSIGLVDFFVVVGLEDNAVNISSSFRKGDFKEQINPTDVIFSGKVLDRYGKQNLSFPEGVDLFCYPRGLQLEAAQQYPKFHSFIHTSGTGVHSLGCCFTFYAEITESQILAISQAVSTEFEDESFRFNAGAFYEQKYFVPRSICIISKWPFINEFKKCLCEFYRLTCSVMDIPIERVICNFVDDVPAPPAGRIDIHYYIREKMISFKSPPLNQPTSWSSLPVEPLFECLAPEYIISLFVCVLLERQIVFVSSQLSLLTSAAETIKSLIYPFRWSHNYIPVLPLPLVGMLCAPFPFLVGIHSSFLLHEDCCISEESVVIYLDENRLTFGSLGTPFRLPDHRHNKLLKGIQSAAPAFVSRDRAYGDWITRRLPFYDAAYDIPVLPEFMDDAENVGHLVDERSVRESFLNFFVSVLVNYRDFLVRDERFKKFRDEDFVRSCKVESRDFFDAFIKTQLFNDFLDERLLVDEKDPDIAFFEESIQAKKNRCGIKFRIQPTPFLLDKSHEHTKTHVPPKPDASNLPTDRSAKFIYTNFPSKLNPEYFASVRSSSLSHAEIKSLTSTHLKLGRSSAGIARLRSREVRFDDRKRGTRFPSNGRISTPKMHVLPGGLVGPISPPRDDGFVPTSDTMTSGTLTATECIFNVYLIVLAQTARCQALREGSRRGRLAPSTRQIIDKYADGPDRASLNLAGGIDRPSWQRSTSIKSDTDKESDFSASTNDFLDFSPRSISSATSTCSRVIEGHAEIIRLYSETANNEDDIFASPTRIIHHKSADVDTDEADTETGEISINTDSVVPPSYLEEYKESSYHDGGSVLHSTGVVAVLLPTKDSLPLPPDWCFSSANASLKIAVEILQVMIKNDIGPDDMAYRLLADACASGSLCNRAIDLMICMQEEGVLPDAKIATAVSIALSGSRRDEISSMMAVDVIGTKDWRAFAPFGLLGTDSEKVSEVSSSPIVSTPELSSLSSVECISSLFSFNGQENPDNIGDSVEIVDEEADEDHSIIQNFSSSSWIGFHVYRQAKHHIREKWLRRHSFSASKNVLAHVQWSDELLCCLLPELHIELEEPFGTACQSKKCGRMLTLSELNRGWEPDPNNYNVRCIHCSKTFAPQFTVKSTLTGWQAQKNIDAVDENLLWCELLSPWTLSKEVINVLRDDGVEMLLSPQFRQTSQVVFWNMIVSFRQMGLPYSFLLQESFI